MRVNSYHETISFADLEAAMQYAEGQEDKQYICEVINELAENTVKGEMNAYWPLPIEVVGFSSIISNRECTPTPAPQSLSKA